MNEAYKSLQKALEEFAEIKQDLKSLTESNDHREILDTNRLLKNEVIEMAETLD